MRIARNGGVECADPFGRVDDEQRNVGLFEVLARHHDRELLRHQVRLAFTADAGGVDEAKALAIALDQFINRVACGAGDR